MKFYALADLNDPTKIKVEGRSSSRGTIAEVPKELVGKAIKIIDEQSPESPGQTFKKVVLDENAERDRLAKAEEDEIKVEGRRQARLARLKTLRNNKDRINSLTLANLKPVIKALVDEVLGE